MCQHEIMKSMQDTDRAKTVRMARSIIIIHIIDLWIYLVNFYLYAKCTKWMVRVSSMKQTKFKNTDARNRTFARFLLVVLTSYWSTASPFLPFVGLETRPEIIRNVNSIISKLYIMMSFTLFYWKLEFL